MTQDGIGEQRLAANRTRFRRLVWTGVWIGAGFGLIGGIVTGYTRAAHDHGAAGLGWLAWPILVVTLAVFAWYTRYYFRRIDELDLLDNLWASTVGLYAFIMGYPAWVMLHEIGQAGPPRVGPLWWGALGAAIIAYAWRKLRHRF